MYLCFKVTKISSLHPLCFGWSLLRKYLSGLFYVEICCYEVKNMHISAVDFAHYVRGHVYFLLHSYQVTYFSCFPVIFNITPCVRGKCYFLEKELFYIMEYFSVTAKAVRMPWL